MRFSKNTHTLHSASSLLGFGKSVVFQAGSESLPQMSLQQDNAFKSSWKSTRPHAHVRYCHPASPAPHARSQARLPSPGLLSLLTAPGPPFPSWGWGDRDGTHPSRPPTGGLFALRFPLGSREHSSGRKTKSKTNPQTGKPRGRVRTQDMWGPGAEVVDWDRLRGRLRPSPC